MRILFVGDIVGRPGKHACAQVVPRLVRDRQVDLVVANAENIAAGSGITPQLFKRIRNQGVDVCTLGDHIYRRREAYPLLQSAEHAVRSANLPPEAIGREWIVVPDRAGRPAAVFSVLGRTYMNVRADCPFHAAERVLAQLPKDVKIIIVDVHAETTSEKMALGWFLNGKVTAVIGTHTHVPTADERVLPGGTAYISDAGMTGPYDSVLGRDRDAVIKALYTGMPHPFDVATGNVHLSGVIIDADPATGRASSIQRVWEKDDTPLPPTDD